ncbi:hypothetical protein QFC24_006970 [Naganishia onofrii]|uniref:Uncharacterized protein n=1 Tax=Naganishia onofrii TaxID=1851511 RepID=A0ACC2WVL8_9TREE|nr:hypothetical protein QFC24_006970 [Naganishia onofrii]
MPPLLRNNRPLPEVRHKPQTKAPQEAPVNPARISDAGEWGMDVGTGKNASEQKKRKRAVKQRRGVKETARKEKRTLVKGDIVKPDWHFPHNRGAQLKLAYVIRRANEVPSYDTVAFDKMSTEFANPADALMAYWTTRRHNVTTQQRIREHMNRYRDITSKAADAMITLLTESKQNAINLLAAFDVPRLWQSGMLYEMTLRYAKQPAEFPTEVSEAPVSDLVFERGEGLC